MFDWINSTVEECAWEIAERSHQSIVSVISYHTRKGNTEVLTKVAEARILAKSYRVILRGKAAEERLIQERCANANSVVSGTPSKDVGVDKQ